MPKFAVNGFLTQPHFHPEHMGKRGYLESFAHFCNILIQSVAPPWLFVKALSANSCRICARLSSSQVCGIGRNRFGQEA